MAGKSRRNNARCWRGIHKVSRGLFVPRRPKQWRAPWREQDRRKWLEENRKKQEDQQSQGDGNSYFPSDDEFDN